MTQLLEQAFTRIASLPEQEQDHLAAFILAEVESEMKWDSLFAASGDILEKLADEAEAEFQSGKTEPLDLNRDFPKD